MGEPQSQLGNRQSDRDRTGGERKGRKMGAQMRNIKLIGRLVSEIRGFEIGKKRKFAQIYPGNRPIPWAADVRHAESRKRCEIRGRHAWTTNSKPGSADRVTTSFPVRMSPSAGKHFRSALETR